MFPKGPGTQLVQLYLHAYKLEQAIKLVGLERVEHICTWFLAKFFGPGNTQGSCWLRPC